jgi:hypothetical protein
MTRRFVLVVLALAVVGALAAGRTAIASASFDGSSSVAQSTVSTATLQPPTGLGATPGCSLSLPMVALSWTPPSGPTVGYDVGRSTTPGGPYSVIRTVAAGQTVFSDVTGLLLATLYRYVVRSTTGNWTSAWSSEATALTLPVCP